jgi:hypothetical protein
MFTEHRQGLCQQTRIDDKNQSHLLMIYVSEWEEKSIEKIRRIAQDMRVQVSQFDDIHNGEFFDYIILECKLLSIDSIVQKLNQLRE